jgi:hypothetical protein
MMTDVQAAIEAMDFLLRPSATVSTNRVIEWLESHDPDVLSIIYEGMSRSVDRVVGGISAAVYFRLVSRLFATLLEEEGRTQYALSRYDAARIYAAFLLQCAREANDDVESSRLLRVAVQELESAYKRGEPASRRCIVDGILEHVFQNAAAHGIRRSAASSG